MPIPWYYTWTDRFFHEILQNSMKDSAFSLISTNAVFSQNLIVDSLENSHESYIIWSDSDLIIKFDVLNNLQPYIDSNVMMAFLQEESEPCLSFMLLKVCPEVINFFKNITDIKNINNEIGEFKGTWKLLDNQTFTCSTTWNMSMDFSIMKPLTSNLGKEFDFAEKIFLIAQHLDVQPYMQYVPENIIPFIYKFQELLYLSHQEAKTARNL
jgi:hypothetical protein